MDPTIRWPLQSNVIRHGKVSNTFGMVRMNANGTKRPHQGWDFYAAIDTPCYAIADGTVAHIGKLGDYGNIVVHSFRFDNKTIYAAYAHLKSIAVALGQKVSKGDRIGMTGDSGNAKGMNGKDLHLHFEIRTTPTPGRGLAQRLTPLGIFRQVPLDVAILDPV